MEKINVFLGDIANATRYLKATLNVRNLLPREIEDNAPPEYRLGNIADTICNHSSVEERVGLDAFYGETTQPHIKSTEAPSDDTEAAIHWVNGKEKCPKRPHVQCAACNQYGHEAKTCDQPAKLYWTAKYTKDNSDDTLKVAEAFKQKHQLSIKATVHALISEMETFDKSNFKSEQHAQCQEMLDCISDSMVICHATAASPTTLHHFIQDITSAPTSYQINELPGRFHWPSARPQNNPHGNSSRVSIG